MLQTTVVEKIKTQLYFQKFFRKSWRICDIVVEYDGFRQNTDNNTIWRVPFACSTTKATYRGSECVIISAFPLQQRLHERASMLHYA